MLRRFGIGGRLFLAFVAIASLSLTSGVVGWLSLREVTETQERVFGEAMPAIAATQAIAKRAESIVARAPRLTQAQSELERQLQADGLLREGQGLQALLNEAAHDAIGQSDLDLMQDVVTTFTGNLDQLNRLVGQRLQDRALQERLSENALAAAVAITDLSETLVSNAAAAASAVISNLYHLVDEPGLREEAYLALDRLIEEDIYSMERMFELRLRSSQLGLLISRLPEANRLEAVTALEAEYRRQLRIVTRRAESAPDPLRRAQATANTKVLALAAMARSDSNLFALQRRLLRVDASLALLAEENRALSEELGRITARLVETTSSFSLAAAEQAKGAAHFAFYALIAVSLASLLLSAAILWLYVQRRVVRRLTGMASSVRRLAGGDFDTRIPLEGRDELTDMARALEVLKAEGLRKRELEQERERINEELRQHREELQQLVAERTRQLEDANSQLISEAAEHAKARAAAEAANRAKTEFLATMSHEIRTPVSGLLGLLRMLQDETKDREQQRQLELAGSAGETLLSLLGNVLDYSKVEAGHLELELLDYDVAGLLDGIALLLQPAAHGKGLAFHVDLDPELPARLNGDLGKIRQILFNLAGNAVKFTDEGDVTLRVRKGPAETLIFEVEDSGPGIAADAQRRIFEPFAQLDPSIARQHGGAGLGLAICKQLTQLLDGRLTVESATGEGSRFCLQLPLVQAKAAAAPDRLRAKDLVASRSRKIMVVDDDPVSLRVVRAFLQRMGHRVATAHDGNEALSLVAMERPDLVLMDISMPGMDGLEATRRIRKFTDPDLRSLPIVGISAHVFRQELERHLAAGLDRLLSKPVFPERLFETIEAIFAAPGDAPEWDDQVLAQQPEAAASDAGMLLDAQVLTEDAAMLGLTAVERILKSYRKVVPEHLSAIAAAQDRGDLQAMGRTAHAIKSAAGAVGAVRLAQCADRCERAARDGRDEAAFDSAGQFAALHKDSLVAIADLIDRLQMAAE
ncbi:MAG: TMAO reductase system sensor histidine kinase/response regulator TorS [Kiloniellales bacterium]